MRPRKLTICGWGPYRAEEKIDFESFEGKGIFLITGATGAGKTTIFDAICYALYGSLSGTERDKERSSVRSDFAGEGTPTYVELLMEHGGKEYLIRRNPEYLRPKKRNNGGVSLTKEKENAVLTYPDGRVVEGVREVNAAVKELLVLDYQQFKKISMIAQGEFAKLLIASPKEKTQIFREIFGTGVYEQFTQELGQRARAAYGQIMEQRNKLEEDLRLLAVGLEHSGWSEDIRGQLLGLVASENRNDEAVELCLANMEEQAKGQLEESKKEYVSADKKIERLAGKLAGLEEENRRIVQLLQAEKEVAALTALAPEMEKKQAVYMQAMNAGWVESAEERFRQQERRIAENRKEIAKVQESAEVLRVQLKKGQEAYCKQERLCQEAKCIYEEAEHRRRLDAIGLAAELLEDGKPCPVCGSLEHPAPAAASANMVSEEELKRLKREAQRLEKELLGFHGDVAERKTKLDGALLQYQQLEEAAKALEAEAMTARTAFDDTLKEYGFADAEEYRAAKLSGGERNGLAKEIENYKARKAAAEELCRHLQENIKSREPIDLTEERELLAVVRARKDGALKQQKLWERHLSEVKKTRKLMGEKRELMEAQKEQYGYVKDLENLANGNNKARLVFEQYVLAGYFEEILHAANLRFSKMTGGRYEMSRVPQVGDGRVKDNLEIQVLDYYTGKHRSVRTLSGGESFKASLALALGMSDVIQSMNGGIRVDTLFVDEGFGALDEESLDQACETLMGLVEKKRLIGIISHVPQLRERIESQLMVEKTGSGSRIFEKIS